MSLTEIRKRLDRRQAFIQQYKDAARKYPELKIKNMLSKDSKVGGDQDCRAWNLPLRDTCCAKGSGIASPTCRSICYCQNFYLDRGRILYPKQEKTFKISQLPEFSDIMIGAVHTAAVAHFRLHSFGEFYSLKYMEDWIRIIKECDGVTFLAYTRTWRIAEWLPTLNRLAALPGMNLFFSYDRDTGLPPTIPNVRRAWLAATDNEPPPITPHKQDVIFRGTAELTEEIPDNRRRYTLAENDGNLGGFFTCPHENGKSKTESTKDCVSCRHCFFKERVA
jgi:Gene product 88